MKTAIRKCVSTWLICMCIVLLVNAEFVSHAAAQESAQRRTRTASPSVDSILDRYVAAVGGVEAWKKLSTRVVTGTVELSPPLLKGRVELYQLAPDKMFFQMKVPSLGVAWVLVNGEEGWQKDFASEPRRLVGAELLETKGDADFSKEMHLRKLYSRMEYKGTSIIDSRTADVVRAFTATGRSHTLYFDKDSGLLLREDFVSITTRGRETVETYFGDYRELKDVGVKYPFLVRQVTARAVQTMRFEQVQHNVPVDSAMFAAPNQ